MKGGGIHFFRSGHLAAEAALGGIFPLQMRRLAPLGGPGVRDWRTAPGNGSIALINRWTGQPHEHRREIARRLRQEIEL